MPAIVRRIAAPLALALVVGCAPAAFMAEPAGSVAGAEIARGQLHERATARFRASNIARAMNGMPLLDSCSERYWVDRDWARKDSCCAARIRRYEYGDYTALDPPGLPVPTTRATVPDSLQRVYDERAKAAAVDNWKYQGQGAPRRR